MALVRSGDKTIGYLSEVTGKLLKEFDIKYPVFYATLNWDDVLDLASNALQYREVSRFPSVTRDLSLVVDKNVSYNEIEGIALSCKIPELKSIELFDVFESDKLGTGKKSMAVSFIFLNDQKTLTDKEIDIFMQKILIAYQERVKAAIRK